MDASKFGRLMVKHPGTASCFIRYATTSDSQHTLLDTDLIKAALDQDWNDDEIIDLIREANAYSGRLNIAAGYCQVLIEDARESLKTGGITLAQRAAFEVVSEYWSLAVVQVIKHGKENALWHLRLKDGREINLGPTKRFLDPKD